MGIDLPESVPDRAANYMPRLYFSRTIDCELVTTKGG
jgi:hypothetical protein